MKQEFWLIILLAALSTGQGCKAQTGTAMEDSKEIMAGDMKVKWRFEGKDLLVEAIAPTTGWVAVGFNPQNEIVHTNLVIAALKADDIGILEDQYVAAIGQHKNVAEMGGIPSAVLNSISTQNGTTTVQFRQPIAPADQFHYTLSPGTEIYLICAYSAADDFNHHSRMRKHIKVKL